MHELPTSGKQADLLLELLKLCKKRNAKFVISEVRQKMGFSEGAMWRLIDSLKSGGYIQKVASRGAAKLTDLAHDIKCALRTRQRYSLSLSAVKVLWAIEERPDAVVPPLAELEQATGLSNATVKTCLAELETAKLVKRGSSNNWESSLLVECPVTGRPTHQEQEKLDEVAEKLYEDIEDEAKAQEKEDLTVETAETAARRKGSIPGRPGTGVHPSTPMVDVILEIPQHLHERTQVKAKNLKMEHEDLLLRYILDGSNLDTQAYVPRSQVDKKAQQLAKKSSRELEKQLQTAQRENDNLKRTLLERDKLLKTLQDSDKNKGATVDELIKAAERGQGKIQQLEAEIESLKAAPAAKSMDSETELKLKVLAIILEKSPEFRQLYSEQAMKVLGL